jgi:ribA/ribD-fused uncharacterized protein
VTPIDRFAGPWAFLSNFYPAEATLDGIVYPSVEHAFQAAKTYDAGIRAAIRAAATPGDAKRLGRQLRLRRDWETVKVGVMRELLADKFTNNLGCPGFGGVRWLDSHAAGPRRRQGSRGVLAA